MSGLPSPHTALRDMTDAEVAALLAFHQDELKREWCGTLIMGAIDELRDEQARRRKDQPPDIGPDVPGGGAV